MSHRSECWVIFCLFVCSGVHTCAWTWKPDASTGYHAPGAVQLVFWDGSLIDLNFKEARPASVPRLCPSLPPHPWNCDVHPTGPGFWFLFVMWVLEFESRSSCLQEKPSSQSWICITGRYILNVYWLPRSSVQYLILLPEVNGKAWVCGR